MKVKIPASVAMMAGKIPVESMIAEEYKGLERPLRGVVNTLGKLDGYINPAYKEAEEAWNDLHKNKEPVISAKYYEMDFIKNLKYQVEQLEMYLDQYAEAIDEIEK